MSSYIELDKQSSFPSATNTGKIVFGVSTSGEPKFTDSTGNSYTFGTGSLYTTASLPYKEYFAIITQAGTDAPTVDSVVINTLGFTPVWEYVGGGEYRIPFSSTLDSRKLTSDIIKDYDGNTPITGYKVANDAAISASNFSNFNNTVITTVTQSDGKILVGGSFTSFNGTGANRIIRLNSNGSIDGDFSYGSGFGDNVYTIAIQSDGKITVGGDFSGYNGTAVNNIVRLNSNGSIDNTFNIGTGFDNQVYTIAIQSDGKILVGGTFQVYNGTGTKRLIRLNTDGSIDNTFTTGDGCNSDINTIAIQSDGKILVGGDFSNYNETGINRIARLNSDGSIDNTFNIGTGFNSPVRTIAIQSDGKILVGGDFSDYDGTTASCITRLNTDGLIDNAFNIGTGFNDFVNTITIQSDGKILVGGRFTGYDSTDAYRIARLNINGTIDSTNFLVGNLGFNSTVNTIATLENGNILAGGDFTADIDNDSPYSYMALINNPYSYQIKATGDSTLNQQQIYLKINN